MEKIAILDYTSGQLKVIQIKEGLQIEEVEELLEEEYGYRIKDIHWMKVNEISIDHISILEVSIDHITI